MDRVVIITGSTRGIGLATAAEFLRNGDRVVVFCRHEAHVQEAARKLRAQGPGERILPLVGDVRKVVDVEKIVKQTVDTFDRIDVLINNAGIAVWKDIEATSEPEWDDVLDTNLKGYYLFAKEVVPIMKKQKSGMIINISSGLGARAAARYSAYSSSKFGIIGLTQVLTEETKGFGIEVFSVLPGAVATKLHLGVHPWEDPKTMMTPEYVGRKIFELASGKQKSGESVEINKDA